MYLPRLLAPALGKALSQFPAVLITGPRQSGKTTFLLREFAQGAHYLSFDDPLERSFARDDPNAFLDRFPEGRIILDEIQYVPEILQHLKLRIDRDRHRYGRWLLTGSQQFQLMAGVSESLAGRLALLDLLPLSLLEHPQRAEEPLSSVLWNSAFPEPALAPGKRDAWLSSYIQTYLERDVRQLRNVQDLRGFETFLALAAASHAQELSLTGLSRDLGVTQPTVKAWLSVLEAGYVVRTLPPYFENYGKRVIKSPKLYFLDSALVCALTRQPAAEAALAGAMGGALFEGFVVSEAYKVFALLGKRPGLFFWRSHDRLEVDLLLRLPRGLTPVEIKLTATPTARHTASLKRFKDLAGKDASGAGLLVCSVAERRPLPGGNEALPWREWPGWLYEQLSGFEYAAAESQSQTVQSTKVS